MGRRDKFSSEYRELIAALVEHREAVGLTQAALARALKTDQSRISKFERLERRLDVVDFVRFCHAIGVAPGPLLEKVFPRKTASRVGR